MRILTLNSGSSSLKAALYETGGQETMVFAVEAERIGKGNARLTGADGRGKKAPEKHRRLTDHRQALEAALEWLEGSAPGGPAQAASHRIVHGGRRYSESQRITVKLIDELRELVPLDPDHLPQAIADIETIRQRHPGMPQVACFDTAFHRRMPRVAQLYALPERYFDEGILRYGFHGISYEYIVSELSALEGASAGGRAVVAHLGHGASLAAIRNGRGIDTSMGFTPASGLPMGRRSGDVDPGVLLHLLAEKKMTVEELSGLINREAGLLGVSGRSGDMQDLLSEEKADPRAAEAIALFCYRAKKYIGAYAAALGGLDTLVFTAGIGEHAPAIRERICGGLEALGIRIDAERNRRGAAVISGGGAVTVRVMKTNENLMLARHAAEVLQNVSR